MKHYRKYFTAVLWSCLLSVLLLITMLLHSTVRLSRDDFFYYPFLRHGFLQFLYQLLKHYMLVNGRLLVHSICAIFLHQDPWLFMIVNSVVLLAFLFFLVLCTKNRKAPIQNILLFLIAFSAFWMTGNYVIAESVLWISGAFNYLFPALLLAWYVFTLLHAKKTKDYWLLLLLGALSSVTTELTSVLTLLIGILALWGSGKTGKRVKPFLIANVFIIAAGLLFLLLSPGMHGRTGLFGQTPIQNVKDFLIRFTTFSQMSWERHGIVSMIIFSALSCSWFAGQQLKKTPLAILFAGVALMGVLTICGILYAACCYMLLGVLYLTALLWYSVLLFDKGDRIIPVSVLCFMASYGILCVSGIIGYRMLFFPAIWLLAVGLRSIALSEISLSAMYTLCIVIVIAAVLQVSGMISANRKNAVVWDENQDIVREYQDEKVLVFTNVYDELFFQGGVPVKNNFGDSYLREFGIGSNVETGTADRKYYTVTNGRSLTVSPRAIKRHTTYYIRYDDLVKYLNAEHEWSYEAITIYYQGEIYRFHYGAHSVLTAFIGGWSKKLTAPVRIVDSWLYIPVEDANRLFHLDLMISGQQPTDCD